MLCQIGVRDFLPLSSDLTLGIVCQQHIWCSNFSNEILVSTIVIFFPVEQANSEELCYQMDEKLNTLETIDRFDR